MKHLKIDCFNDLGKNLVSLEIFNFSIDLNQESEKTIIQLSDFVARDHTLFNNSSANTVFRIGKFTTPNVLDFDFAEVLDHDDVYNFINESFKDNAEQSMHIAPNINRTLFEKSLLQIRNRLQKIIVNFPRIQKQPEISKPELPEYLITISIDSKYKSIKIKVKNILLLWNTMFFNTVLEYAIQLYQHSMTIVHKIFKHESKSNASFFVKQGKSLGETDKVKKEDPHRKSEFIIKNHFGRNSRLKDIDSPIHKTPDEPSFFQIGLLVERIVILNFNKAFFQTEFILDDLWVKLDLCLNKTLIELKNKSLIINDLTGYPFTKFSYELTECAKLKRNLVAEIRVPPQFESTESAVKNSSILNVFRKYSLYAVCKILDSEEAEKGEQKIKTTAEVHINNLQVQYYQQLAFRLIDLISLNILPFVLQETFPVDRKELWVKMTNFFRTNYTVSLYNTLVCLKPSPLFQNDIRFRIIETKVQNKIERDRNDRDLTKQNREFYIESIFIDLNKVFFGGYDKSKESNLTNSLGIVFTRLLFKNEIKAYYGKENFLKTIFFGNSIKISGDSLHMSLFKNDFIFFMTVLFSNINFDDNRNNDYVIDGIPEEDYVNPMVLTVDFWNLFVYFRYDREFEKPKVFTVFTFPNFCVKLIKSFNNKKDVRVSSTFIKASAFEIIDKFKESILSVPFIIPIRTKQKIKLDDFGIELIKNADEDQASLTDQSKTVISQNETLFIQNQNANQFEKVDQPPTPSKRLKILNDTFFFQHEDQKEDLFLMTVRLDSNGNQTKITIKDHNLMLIQNIFFSLLEFVRMTEEMNINMKMQPLLESVPSNIEFNLELIDTIITFPFDQAVYPNPIQMYINDCQIVYTKFVRKYTPEMAEKIRFFKQMPKSPSSNIVDHSLSMFETSYVVETFIIFENLMSINLKGVHAFVSNEPSLNVLLQTFSQKNMGPNFNDSNFVASIPNRDTKIRFLCYDLSLCYSITSLFSNNYKSLNLSKGILDNKNFAFALSCYDINFLSDLNASLTNFNFGKLVLDDTAQKEMESILLLNLFEDRNRYFYTKDTTITKQRRFLSINELKLKLMVLDDIFGTMNPIFDVHIKVKPTTMFKTHIFEDYMSMEIDLEASYFNIGIHVWEPVFENLSFVLQKSFNLKTNNQELIIKTLNTAACINLSTAMLDLVGFIQTNLLKRKAAQRQIPYFQQSLYHISNQTGKLLEIYAIFSGQQAVRIIVMDGQTKKISNLQIDSKNLKVSKIEELKIFGIQMEDDLVSLFETNKNEGKLKEFLVNGEKLVLEKTFDGKVILHRPIDDFFASVFLPKTDKTKRLTQSETSNQRLKKQLLISVKKPLSFFTGLPLDQNGHLFYVSMEKTQTVLRVSSRYLIKNIASLDLVIKFTNESLVLHKLLHTNSEINVPVEFETGGIYVSERIFDREVPIFSERIDLTMFDLLAENKSKKGNSEKSKNSHEFWIHFNKRFILVKIKSDKIRHEIILAPSLILENRTFRRLHISDADGQGFDILLKKHQINYNAYFQIKEIINLRFKFANCKSQIISFHRNEFLNKPFEKKFWLTNENAWPIVKLYLHIPKSDCLRIIFYHKNILLNETFVNWWFSQSLRFREIRNLVLLHEIGDCPQILFVKQKSPLLFAVENENSNKIQLDICKVGPTFYEIELADKQKYEFTITLENRKVSDFAEITQNIVHFVPKYVFINKSKNAIFLADISKSRQTKIEALSRKAISFVTDSKLDHKLRLRFTESEWSEPIPYSSSAFYLFSVNSIKKDKLYLVNLEINFSNNSYYIVLLESEFGCCGFKNYSKIFSLLIFQDKSKITSNDYDLEVFPEKKTWYAWKNPLLQTDYIYVVVIDNKTREAHSNIVLKVNKTATREMVKIRDKNYFFETFQKGFAIYVKFMSSDSIYPEDPTGHSCLTSKTILEIDELGISVIYGEKLDRKELFYANFSKLYLRSLKNDKQTEHSLDIDYFSVDFNAKLSAVFPVLFVPKYNRRILKSKNVKFLKMHLIKKMETLGLNVFEHISIDLYPCVLKIEEDFLVHSIRFFTELSQNTSARTEFFEKQFPIKQQEFNLTDSLKKNWKMVPIEDTRSVFFQEICLSKMEIICSFRKSLESRQTNNQLGTYLNLQNSIGAFLITIDDLPLTLPQVKLNRDSKSIPVLKELILSQYKKVIFNTVIKFIASSNIIGNPLSLYNEIRMGIKALIQKETRSDRKSGFVSGTESFIKHFVVGTSGTINKMTRTMGDGLSALTIDNEYLLEREKMFTKSENKFLIGLKQFGYGIYDGLKGVVIKPIQGGRESGFSGVMKGTYQGLSGLILKPATGVLDMASATADAIRELCINKELMSSETRKRFPRAFYRSIRYYKKYEINDANFAVTQISKDGFQLIHTEDINFNLEKIVICLEGIFITFENKIVWRKEVEYLIGSYYKNSLLTVEYFDILDQQIVHNTRLIDYNTENSGEKINKAIWFIINLHSPKDEEEDEEESIYLNKFA